MCVPGKGFAFCALLLDAMGQQGSTFF